MNGYRKDRRDVRNQNFRYDNPTNNYVGQGRKESKVSKKDVGKPGWRNVYGKSSQPADGAVNAFQWSD